MQDLSLFKRFSKKETAEQLKKLSRIELLESAIDCIHNSKHFLEASKFLIEHNKLYKPAQILSGIAIEELAKCKALLDLIENKKIITEVVDFFYDHSRKYFEIYNQKKYSKHRDVVRKHGAYVSFTTIKTRPLMYANEGFEGLVIHEVEDVENGIPKLENRIKKLR